ncbi:unnamed protein product [marine sediment metagenome]|uniref:Uncharacterized protein n=1 Tax=marine sediment metagenome TaxID=412755 RepID=X0XPX6_9ZZZZ
MGFIENLLDNFSAKDLRSRLSGVIVAGLLLCAAASAGLYLLLTQTQRINVEGTARWEEAAGGIIDVAVDGDDLRKLADISSLRVEALDPAEGMIPAECSLLSTEPSPPTVTIECPGMPRGLKALERFEVKLVLVDEPMWRLLWGRHKSR